MHRATFLSERNSRRRCRSAPAWSTEDDTRGSKASACGTSIFSEPSQRNTDAEQPGSRNASVKGAYRPRSRRRSRRATSSADRAESRVPITRPRLAEDSPGFGSRWRLSSDMPTPNSFTPIQVPPNDSISRRDGSYSLETHDSGWLGCRPLPFLVAITEELITVPVVKPTHGTHRQASEVVAALTDRYRRVDAATPKSPSTATPQARASMAINA